MAAASPKGANLPLRPAFQDFRWICFAHLAPPDLCTSGAAPPSPPKPPEIFAALPVQRAALHQNELWQAVLWVKVFP